MPTVLRELYQDPEGRTTYVGSPKRLVSKPRDPKSVLGSARMQLVKQERSLPFLRVALLVGGPLHVYPRLR